MTLTTIIFGPLLLAATTGIIAARSNSMIVRMLLLLSSPLPPLLQWLALVWYRQKYFDLHPILENKNRAVTAGICEIQMVAAPVIVFMALFIAWLLRRIDLARQAQSAEPTN